MSNKLNVTTASAYQNTLTEFAFMTDALPAVEVQERQELKIFAIGDQGRASAR